MKNLKTNKRILSYLICFSLLAFVNISCETENEIDQIIEASEIEKTSSITMAKKGARANFKRTRLKKRSNGLYRASIIVNNDNKNEVSAIALEIEAKKGVLNETKTYYLEYYTSIKNEKYFTFPDIKFDGKELENQEVVTNITLLDANKKPIYTKTGDICVLSGLSKANIRKRSPSIFLYPKSSQLRLTAEIENNEDNEVAAVEVSVSDLYGNTVKDKTEPKKGKNKDKMLLFVLNENGEIGIEDKILRTQFTLKDLFGDVISIFREEVTVESDIKIGSSKIELRPNGLISASIKIKKDTENQVNSIMLQIEKEEGLVSEPLTYILKDYESIKNIKYFTFNGLKFDNDDIVGKEVSIKITLLDNNQRPIGKLFAERRAEVLKANYKSQKLSDMEG